MSRFIRHSRVVFAACCGAACAFLLALWLRSYWWVDGVQVQVTENNAFVIGSLPGCIGANFFNQPRRTSLPRCSHTVIEADRWMDDARRFGEFVPSRVWGTFYSQNLFRVVPYWFAMGLLILAPTALAVAPRLRWRFSLRTMLVTMTIIAAVIAIAAYIVRGR